MQNIKQEKVKIVQQGYITIRQTQKLHPSRSVIITGGGILVLRLLAEVSKPIHVQGAQEKIADKVCLCERHDGVFHLLCHDRHILL